LGFDNIEIKLAVAPNLSGGSPPPIIIIFSSKRPGGSKISGAAVSRLFSQLFRARAGERTDRIREAVE